MSLLLKQIFSFIQLLNSETGTHQIAWGIAFGFILGMSPVFSLQTVLVIIFLFFFRIQIGAALVSGFFFKFIAYLLDPIFHQAGVYILEISSLRPLFTQLYNMPIVPYTRFNNSIVMGSGATSILLLPFIYFLSVAFVKKYRVVVVARFKETKLWHAIRATSLYKWYHSYQQFNS
jgi:uncharacterized protein (TIGR03546 family)